MTPEPRVVERLAKTYTPDHPFNRALNAIIDLTERAERLEETPKERWHVYRKASGVLWVDPCFEPGRTPCAAVSDSLCVATFFTNAEAEAYVAAHKPEPTPPCCNNMCSSGLPGTHLLHGSVVSCESCWERHKDGVWKCYARKDPRIEMAERLEVLANDSNIREFLTFRVGTWSALREAAAMLRREVGK